ncbi:hypothetical protein J5X98_24220 [Leptothermofonsia sichuanensis E412]|uniref:hypothetical protein n=1 Tax=Leptothermofonsia sichuanensis TaxID=2917832 RepID=UPI001CA69E22|nr:hypothetical protein [Leptothermofonsia sichuanensis]QZZ20329.1 hypothetical protein J5X98_24220 [Leptothermofonsia sichuanensis E412]
MVAKTFVYERQVEYWTSRQIEEFFLNAGFNIVVYPVEQRIERYLPADHIFGVDKALVKLFGIQYKALYHNSVNYWKLDQRQHCRLIHFPWIYYGLSDLQSVSDGRNGLHYLRILSSAFPYVNKLDVGSLGPYYHWGAFYQHLQSCQTGRLVQNISDLQEAISPLQERDLDRTTIEVTDIFVANFNTKQLVHLSPQLKQVDTNE